MDDNQIKTMAKEIVDSADLNFKELFENDEEKGDQVNLWLPENYKADFKTLQTESKKKFGKLCKEVLKICIDRAKAKRKAS